MSFSVIDSTRFQDACLHDLATYVESSVARYSEKALKHKAHDENETSIYFSILFGTSIKIPPH
jgi:hypothetical protein